MTGIEIPEQNAPALSSLGNIRNCYKASLSLHLYRCSGGALQHVWAPLFLAAHFGLLSLLKVIFIFTVSCVIKQQILSIHKNQIMLARDRQ